MKTRSWAVIVCLCASFGCQGGEDQASGIDGEKVGMLQLSLTGSDSKNQQYRLRHATFAIDGTRYDTYANVSTTVSSEDDLDSSVLRARLFYGYYGVSLMPDTWYIERATSDGFERVEQAVLLTSGSQSVYVSQGGVTQVGFQFGVDGELIDFIGGELDIGIGIQRAPDRDAGASGN